MESEQLRYLLAARIAALGFEGAPVRQVVPIATRSWLADEFLNAHDMDRELDELVQAFLDFSEDHMPGEPEAWSPQLVARFLTQAPDFELDEELEEMVPMVLSRWVRWSLTRRGLSPDHIEQAAGLPIIASGLFADWCKEARWMRACEDVA